MGPVERIGWPQGLVWVQDTTMIRFIRFTALVFMLRWCKENNKG
jgi:hypothetical protein